LIKREAVKTLIESSLKFLEETRNSFNLKKKPKLETNNLEKNKENNAMIEDSLDYISLSFESEKE